MRYFVMPCREYRRPGSANIEIRRPKEGDETEYWGVYLRNDDEDEEFDTWIADFALGCDAEMYADMRNET